MSWQERGTIRGAVSGLAVDLEHAIWTTSSFSGIRRLVHDCWTDIDSVGIPPGNFPGLTNVLDVAAAPDGTIWVATSDGAARLEATGWVLRGGLDTSDDALAAGVLPTGHRIAAWSRDVVFLGAVGGSILARADGTSAAYGLPATEWGDWETRFGSSGQVRAVAVDEALTVWLATELGLASFSDAQGWRLDRAWPSPGPTAVAVDGRGRVWVGAGRGLFRSDGSGRWQKVTVTPTEGATIEHLAADPSGAILGVAGRHLLQWHEPAARVRPGPVTGLTAAASTPAERERSRPPRIRLANEYVGGSCCGVFGALAYCDCVAPAAAFVFRGRTIFDGPGGDPRELFLCRGCHDIVVANIPRALAEPAPISEVEYLEFTRSALVGIGEPLVPFIENAIADALTDAGPDQMLGATIDATAGLVHEYLNVSLEVRRKYGTVDDPARRAIRLEIARSLRDGRPRIAAVFGADERGEPVLRFYDGVIDRIMPRELPW